MLMRAMAISQTGNADVFEQIQVPKPTIKPGHVLIKVMASSVNPLDYKLRKGAMPHLLPAFPAVLHGDVAGIVEAIGEGVTQFSPGDEVYGCVGGLLDLAGALSEYVLADSALIAQKPKTLNMSDAAALPLVSLTAYDALITCCRLQKDETILIHGATGGVGHVAIQLAKILGATVYTSTSTKDKQAIAKTLHADYVIDYRHMTVEDYVTKYTENRGFDVVFDTIGGDNLPRCFQAAALYGRVVSIQGGGQFDLTPAFTKALTIHFVLQPLPLITGKNRAHYGEVLRKIAAWVDAGQLRPLVDEKQFKMEDVKYAHQHLESGEAIGKVVVHGFQ